MLSKQFTSAVSTFERLWCGDLEPQPAYALCQGQEGKRERERWENQGHGGDQEARCKIREKEKLKWLKEQKQNMEKQNMRQTGSHHSGLSFPG